ncbi:MAG: hypothetical protein K8I02_06455 [Candidatus Methylomirabilis sp.]|nr:hypothetical protein [Deltaproteobacteria bacterium]
MDGVERAKGVEELKHWRLCRRLTIVQAALLMLDIDPSGEHHDVEQNSVPYRPRGYEPNKIALSDALEHGEIAGQATPRCEYDFDRGKGDPIEGTIDPNESHLEQVSLRNWLALRGYRSKFFDTPEPAPQEFLDPSHDRYAPKLAAVVRAWQAFQEVPGKTPKQVLEKWLREHAAEYGLCDDDGNPRTKTIEEMAKIANWKPGGGAPKTPGE